MWLLAYYLIGLRSNRCQCVVHYLWSIGQQTLALLFCEKEQVRLYMDAAMYH